MDRSNVALDIMLKLLYERFFFSLFFARAQQWKILHLLRWTVFGHHVQRDDAPENPVLHRQSNYSVHGHQFPDHIGVLFAIRQRRKGELPFDRKGRTMNYIFGIGSCSSCSSKNISKFPSRCHSEMLSIKFLHHHHQSQLASSLKKIEHQQHQHIDLHIQHTTSSIGHKVHQFGLDRYQLDSMIEACIIITGHWHTYFVVHGITARTSMANGTLFTAGLCVPITVYEYICVCMIW